MTTASQTPHTPPDSEPLAAAPSSPDIPHRLQVRGPEPASPQCYTCGDCDVPLQPCPSGRRYASGAQVLYCRSCLPPTPTVQAAEGFITAGRKRGEAPRDTAEAMRAAGILFDAQAAADIAAAAAEQAHAEDQAEIAERGRQLAAVAGDHRSIIAVQSLLFGRPDSDLLFVREVLAALDPQRPADAPPTLTWAGLVMGPSGDTEDERTLVPLNTSFGARAFLTLTDDQRLELAGLLAQPLRAGACETPGCGMAEEDLDASDPTVTGWVLVDVAGSSLGARWWCTPLCANAAVTAGGADIAAADLAAADDPGQQGHTVPAEDDVARCARCKCTDNAACEGGCAWVPNDKGIDLCSACATPEELALAGWQATGGAS